MNQPERPINLRRPSKHEKAVLLQNYAAKRRTSLRSGARRNTTGALTVNGSSARRLRTASVAVGLEAAARPDGSAPLEAASEPSLSCFGALCSVIRAATDYCRYGNLRQYLLIDPESGEPKHIYSAGRYLILIVNFGVKIQFFFIFRLETQRSTSESKTSALNGSEYILPPEIRAEIVAAAKRGKLQQYLQLRKHSLQLQASRSLSSGDTSITPFSPCKAEQLLSSTAFSTAANVLQATQTRQGNKKTKKHKRTQGWEFFFAKNIADPHFPIQIFKIKVIKKQSCCRLEIQKVCIIILMRIAIRLVKASEKWFFTKCGTS